MKESTEAGLSFSPLFIGSLADRPRGIPSGRGETTRFSPLFIGSLADSCVLSAVGPGYPGFSPLFIGSLADSYATVLDALRSHRFSPLFIGSLADSVGCESHHYRHRRVSVPYSSGVWLTARLRPESGRGRRSFSPLFIGSLADSAGVSAPYSLAGSGFSPLFIGSLADSTRSSPSSGQPVHVSVPYSSGVWLTAKGSRSETGSTASFQSPIHRESG